MTARSEILSPEDLAARYGGKVSVKTIANWRYAGKGPDYRKIGKRVFYVLDDVEKWELERKIKTQ